jgi:CHAT domain-containing protein
MKRYFLLFLISFPILSIAQSLSSAQNWVDSAELLIHENLDLEFAKKLNTKATQFYKQKNNLEGWLHCQINEIIYLAQKKQFSTALLDTNRLQGELSKLPNNHQLYGLYYQAKAWCLWGMTDYTQALYFGKKASVILKKNQKWSRYVDALLICSYSIYFDDKATFDSIDYYIETTYTTAQQRIDSSRQVFRYIYQLYGSILYQHGRIEQAISLTKEGLYYEQQLIRSQHPHKDSTTLAKYYSNLGRMYASRNDIEPAITYYINAYLVYQKLQKASDIVKVCIRLGDLYVQKDNIEEADRFYAKINLWREKLPQSPILQKRLKSYNHLTLSNYFLHFKQTDSLLNYYKNNLPYIIQYDLAIDKAYENIALALEQQKAYKSTIANLQKALDYTQQKYKQSGTKVAQLFFEIGRVALLDNQSDLAIRMLDSVIQTLHHERIPESDQLFLLEALLDKSIAARAYEYRAKAYDAQGNWQKAQQDIQKVILLANYLRDNYSSLGSKTLSTNQLRPVYEHAAQLNWQLHPMSTPQSAEVIFDLAEQSKSTLLHTNIAKFRKQTTGIPTDLLHHEEALLIKIEKCKAQIIAAKQAQNGSLQNTFQNQLLLLRQQLDSLEITIKNTFPQYRTWQQQQVPPTTTIATVQKTLSPNSVLIEYLVAENACFVLYITSDTCKVKKIVNYDYPTLRTDIKYLRRTLTNVHWIRNKPQLTWRTFLEKSHLIYQTLVEDELLVGKKELIIIADADLHYIPFEVLLSKTPQDTSIIDYAALDYLLKDFSIHYQYSAAIMQQNQSPKPILKGNILGMAAAYNYTQSYNELSPAQQANRTSEENRLHQTAAPITGAARELQLLQKQYRGDYWYDKKATEGHFKELLQTNEYSILHLALHGVVDKKKAAYSCLLFTEDGNPKEDNLLYAYEAQHLMGDHANLVVLSACQTGEGKYEKGEGIISMGRSFIYAGIPSVVMTLWELNDKTSVTIMERFYANLANGQPKSIALQKAKLDFIRHQKRLAHPFFWGSFVSIGNQQPISLDNTTDWWWYISLGAVGLIILVGVWWYKYH